MKTRIWKIKIITKQIKKNKYKLIKKKKKTNNRMKKK